MAGERIGLYPGTFDPITTGHAEIIRRSMRVVDRLILAPAMNISKGPLFTLEERCAMLQEAIAELPADVAPRLSIVPFTGLLVHFSKAQGATVIVRGLRTVSDFEYEIQMSNMNARMEPSIETIFLVASDRHQFIASSLIKDIARLGGDTSPFVSAQVHARLKAKFAGQQGVY